MNIDNDQEDFPSLSFRDQLQTLDSGQPVLKPKGADAKDRVARFLLDPGGLDRHDL